MGNSNGWIVFDGQVIPAEKAIVPAVSRGLMYGDGVFDTLRTYSGKTFLLQAHLDRLKSGMEVLGIRAIPDLEARNIRPLLDKLLQKKKLTSADAVIRLQVWRDGHRGYMPNPEADSHFSITAASCPDTFNYPKLVTVDHRRIPDESMPSAYKFTNGINYILAARDAHQQDGDDALMQTVGGWISETTIANIFWVKGNTVFTPSEDCDLIPGITRDTLIKIIERQSNSEIREDKFGLDHITSADTAWICNSVREVLPVESVNGHTFDVEHSVLKEIRGHFQQVRKNNLELLK